MEKWPILGIFFLPLDAQNQNNNNPCFMVNTFLVYWFMDEPLFF